MIPVATPVARRSGLAVAACALGVPSIPLSWLFPVACLIDAARGQPGLESGQSVLGLGILGMLTLPLGLLLALVGIVLGFVAATRIRNSGGALLGSGTAFAGILLNGAGLGSLLGIAGVFALSS